MGEEKQKRNRMKSRVVYGGRTAERTDADVIRLAEGRARSDVIGMIRRASIRCLSVRARSYVRVGGRGDHFDDCGGPPDVSVVFLFYVFLFAGKMGGLSKFYGMASDLRGSRQSCASISFSETWSILV